MEHRVSLNPPDKIADAVRECLAFSENRKWPIDLVPAYIETLRLLPGWTEEELAEVNRLAIERLRGGG
jgi:hypothetical protein